MAIFFIILLTIIVISYVFMAFSYLKIEIKELEIINKEIKKFDLLISFNLFNKLKWLQLRLNRQKIQELKNSKKRVIIDKLLKTKILKDYRNIKKISVKEWREILKKLDEFTIEQIKFETKIGTENVANTAFVIAIVSILVSLLLARKVQKPQYRIQPVYINKNYIFLSINCIASIRLVHIISIRNNKRKEVCQKNG